MTDSVPAWVKEQFHAIDETRDAHQYLRHFTPDAQLRFGSSPAVAGRDNFLAPLQQYFALYSRTKHEVKAGWRSGSTMFVEGDISYTLRDGSTFTFPFLNKYELRGEAIQRLDIFVDVSPMMPKLMQLMAQP